jgi:hypothetical protein
MIQLQAIGELCANEVSVLRPNCFHASTGDVGLARLNHLICDLENVKFNYRLET